MFQGDRIECHCWWPWNWEWWQPKSLQDRNSPEVWMEKFKQQGGRCSLRNCTRIFHDCRTKSYGQVSGFKHPSSEGTRTVQKNLQSHAWRLSVVVIWYKIIIAMTHWSISIVHWLVSFGTGGGCATWKSTRTLETARCTDAKNRKRELRKRRRARMNGSERQQTQSRCGTVSWWITVLRLQLRTLR